MFGNLYRLCNALRVCVCGEKTHSNYHSTSKQHCLLHHRSPSQVSALCRAMLIFVFRNSLPDSLSGRNLLWRKPSQIDPDQLCRLPNIYLVSTVKNGSLKRRRVTTVSATHTTFA